MAPWECTSLTWSLGSFIVQMHQVVIAFIFHLFSVPLTRSQISQVHIVQNMKIHSGTKKLLYLLHFHLDTPTGSWEIFVSCKIWVSGIKYNTLSVLRFFVHYLFAVIFLVKNWCNNFFVKSQYSLLDFGHLTFFFPVWFWRLIFL